MGRVGTLSAEHLGVAPGSLGPGGVEVDGEPDPEATGDEGPTVGIVGPVQPAISRTPPMMVAIDFLITQPMYPLKLALKRGRSPGPRNAFSVRT